jgi:hypothetical protein
MSKLSDENFTKRMTQIQEIREVSEKLHKEILMWTTDLSSQTSLGSGIFRLSDKSKVLEQIAQLHHRMVVATSPLLDS